MSEVCRALSALALALVLTTQSRGARADAPSFGPNDIETLFFIAKSEGKNRAEYGMRLDRNCAPYGDEPVFPYWRVLEPSPPAPTKSMGTMAKLAYGISNQSVLKRTASGGEATIQLRQVPRTIFLKTSRGPDGRCTALVRTKIGSVLFAQLLSIFVKLSGPLSVTYIDIKGKHPDTGESIEERLRREPTRR
jgi:hypothetical protein